MDKEIIDAEERRSARLVLYGESVFFIIPFIFMVMISYRRGELGAVLYSPEWSLAATILFGQALVRFSAGFSKFRGKKKWQVASLWNILLLTLAMVSLVIYVLQLSEKPSLPFSILQVILFILALFIFIVFGSVGQKLLGQSHR